jgi:hypothetical protein
MKGPILSCPKVYCNTAKVRILYEHFISPNNICERTTHRTEAEWYSITEFGWVMEGCGKILIFPRIWFLWCLLGGEIDCQNYTHNRNLISLPMKYFSKWGIPQVNIKAVHLTNTTWIRVIVMFNVFLTSILGGGVWLASGSATLPPQNMSLVFTG